MDLQTDQDNGSGDEFAMLVRRRRSGESKGVIISLCDLTGVMVAPWVDGGYDAVLVDPQHPTGVSVEPSCSGALIVRVGAVVDSSVTWGGVRALIHGGAVVFISGFPVCTQLAVSGTARWADKRVADPHFQAKAMALVHECRVIGELSGAPYFFENPVSAISSIYRKPDHAFHPNEYGGYLPEDDCHPLYPDYFPPRDAYGKKTCLWAGGGFVMPERRSVPFAEGQTDGQGQSKAHNKLGGKSDKTKNIRSATPRGFAMAVYLANAPHLNNNLTAAPSSVDSECQQLALIGAPP